MMEEEGVNRFNPEAVIKKNIFPTGRKVTLDVE